MNEQNAEGININMSKEAEKLAEKLVEKVLVENGLEPTDENIKGIGKVIAAAAGGVAAKKSEDRPVI